jgi:hypothetical protein
VKENLIVELIDLSGRLVDSTMITQGSSITFFDTKKVYAGVYFVKVKGTSETITRKLVIEK